MSDGTQRDGCRRNCGDEALYAALRRRAFELAIVHVEPADRLAPLCDALWDAMSCRGLSWIGFYLANPEIPTELLLAARRDKPACSPIGMHGVCGQGFLEEATRVVEDVALLGPGYIACDPRDRSEIVVPIYRNGKPWGVLDADSHEQACFGPIDADGLAGVLRAAGLLDRDPVVRADRLHGAAGSL